MHRILPLLSLIPFFVLRPATVADNWVLLANVALLPLSLAAAFWALLSERGLVIAAAILVASPLLAHSIFDVPLLVCVAVVVMRSIWCRSGWQRWLRGS